MGISISKERFFYSSGLILLIIYYILFPSSEITSKLEAVSSILLSLILVFKSRNSIPLMVAMLFLSYCIYSIGVGEYLVGGPLGIPLTEVKNFHIYDLTLRIVLLFMTTLAAFFPKVTEINPPKPKDNVVIFYILIIILVYIGIYGIDRTFSNQYTVNISPMYEYSILLFLFGYFSSGDKFFRKMILVLIMAIYIFQDYYYGGRITSLQIIILAISTIFYEALNKKTALLLTIGGVFVNSLIGAYRTSFSLYGFSIWHVLLSLKDRLLVFDTPVYAYYASATHVASTELINIPFRERIISFFNFVVSIFGGGNNNSGNVTKYVSENYFINVGGGLFPTHFYFWFGWFGVIMAALVVCFIFRKICTKNSDLYSLTAVIVISTIPRWFLYNPLTLFRMIFFVCVLYIIFTYGNRFIYAAVKGTSLKKQ